DRRLAWTFAVTPFVLLAGLLHEVPGHEGTPGMPWWSAAAHAALLFGLMAAHAKCYSLWTPHAPNRMLVNEFLTRSWFGLFGLVVVAAHGDTGPLYLVMASAWVVAAWCTHYLVLRSQKDYRALENLAQLGLFLVGLTLMGLVSIRFALTM
ncbi:MAG: hypothetical protein QOC71_621, partial [Thermoplasmata archaeon]|nr:hypothetical protein [Thermoplasmata archaeon]